MNKILISASSFGECSPRPIEMLRGAGFEVVLNPYKRRLKQEEILALAKDCIGIIAGVEKLNGNILGQLKSLRVISRVGSGLENIDILVARNLGITIKNTPNAPTQAVAELTIGLILNLIRSISLQDRFMHAKKWQKRIGFLLSGKTVGIIGIGRIGKKVAELLQSSNVKIIAYDLKPDIKWATRYNIEVLSLNDLLTISDIVTIHVSCQGILIGEEQLAMMKKRAYLINTSRGKIIDEAALYFALKNDQLLGVALDVFEDEPYSGPLSELDNVILTPHIGSYAKESRITMEIEAVKNLLGGLKKL